MAPGRKKGFVLKRMVSLVATGSKRVAEKFSPRKNKQRKVDFKPDGANKENMPEVSNQLIPVQL
jgi:hypothetical protein